MAMQDGCGSLLKYVFGLVNLIIFAFGCALLGVGVYALTGDTSRLTALMDSPLYDGTAIILIIGGSCIALVSFLGCCGAFTESQCLLALFFCLDLVLFVLVAAGVITGYVLGSEKVLNQMENQLGLSMNKYHNETAIKDSWNFFQETFQCCGLNGGNDWASHQVSPIPQSCCKKDDRGTFEDCQGSPTADNSYTEHGCLSEARQFFAGKGQLFGGIAIGVLVFQLISMVLACTIRQSIM